MVFVLPNLKKRIPGLCFPCRCNCYQLVWSTFFRIWLIRQKGGESHRNILLHYCCIAPSAIQFRFGFHATYWKSWWHSLDSNRPTVRYPKFWLYHGGIAAIQRLNLFWYSNFLVNILQWLWLDDTEGNAKLTCWFWQILCKSPDCKFHSY